jgi:hypothetical protein
MEHVLYNNVQEFHNIPTMWQVIFVAFAYFLLLSYRFHATIYCAALCSGKRPTAIITLHTTVLNPTISPAAAADITIYITLVGRNNATHCAVELDPPMAASATFTYSSVLNC